MGEADWAALAAEEAAARDAVAAFEAEWAAVEAEWKARRRAVNDAYRAVAAAIEEARRAEADPDRPSPVAIDVTVNGEAG